MNKFDFYYRQIVTQSDLDWAFSQVELADNNLVTDNTLNGINDGMDVTENHVAPDLSVDVSQGVGYTDDGKRIYNAEPITNVDCSLDEYGISTSVVNSGNEKWLSLFARFVRDERDPAIDGNGVQVYTKQYESIEFIIHQGSEATIGAASKPALIDDSLLLADINLVYGQTTIQTALHINLDRREDWIRLSGTTLPDFIYGTPKAAIESLLSTIDTWSSSGLPFTFTDTWYNSLAVAGSSPPITAASEALNAIVYDLASDSGTSGAERIGAAAHTTPNSAITWSAGSAYDVLKALADGIDSYYAGTLKWSIPASNIFVVDGVISALTYTDGIYHPDVGKFVVAPLGATSSFYGSIDGQYWSSLGVTTGIFEDCVAIDSQYYMMGAADGIHYTTDPDSTWSLESIAAIGGSESSGLKALATAYPDSDVAIAVRPNRQVRIANSGITNGWVASTSNPFLAYDVRELVYCKNTGGNPATRRWEMLLSDDISYSSNTFVSYDDGDNWSLSGIPDLGRDIVLYDMDCNTDSGVLCAAGREIISGDSDAIIVRKAAYNSAWVDVTMNYPDFTDTSTLRAVKHLGGGYWIACGTLHDTKYYNVLVSKDDGLTWEYVTVNKLNATDDAETLWGIVSTGDHFIITGSTGTVLKSLSHVGF